MKIAVVTFSKLGCDVAEKICEGIPDAAAFVHKDVECPKGLKWHSFQSVMELTAEIFGDYQGIVYVAPCGVAVRAVAPLIKHKTTDPAIVVVDVGGRYAISLLSGHEGGANALAASIANIIGAEPVITTTTEAEKDIIVGIGCRKGTSAERIIEVIKNLLADNKIDIQRVRCVASADVKANEAGLLEAAESLGLTARFISSQEILKFAGAFDRSEFVMKKVGLPAVAEPCALLAGRRTTLIQKKKNCGGITIAVARENFISSE